MVIRDCSSERVGVTSPVTMEDSPQALQHNHHKGMALHHNQALEPIKFRDNQAMEVSNQASHNRATPDNQALHNHTPDNQALGNRASALSQAWAASRTSQDKARQPKRHRRILNLLLVHPERLLPMTMTNGMRT